MNFPPRPSLQYVAIGVYVMLLAGVFLFPSVPIPSWPGGSVSWNMYATVHGVCAQMHNTTIGGMQLPLCARNTGIYGAMTISLLAMWALGRIRTGLLGNDTGVVAAFLDDSDGCNQCVIATDFFAVDFDAATVDQPTCFAFGGG